MSIKLQTENAIKELIELAKLNKGDILVVGCSTSEILGSKIGTNSAPEIAKIVFDGIYKTAKENGYNVVGIYDASEPGQEELMALVDVFIHNYSELDVWK